MSNFNYLREVFRATHGPRIEVIGIIMDCFTGTSQHLVEPRIYWHNSYFGGRGDIIVTFRGHSASSKAWQFQQLMWGCKYSEYLRIDGRQELGAGGETAVTIRFMDLRTPKDSELLAMQAAVCGSDRNRLRICYLKHIDKWHNSEVLSHLSVAATAAELFNDSDRVAVDRWLADHDVYVDVGAMEYYGDDSPTTCDAVYRGPTFYDTILP